jgi:hypothetical protein
MKIKATFRTNSNYKNVNDIELDVKRLSGRFIEAFVPRFGFDENGNPQGEFHTTSFTISELINIREEKA